ncbi:MAG TPA: efflux RND transporter periplasmic adaptor subunit [Pyrinomonadaceae bacterium]|jgi:multidrug efflux pump subunit AcrA (membrane-fusion protein)|nr:efflux RND transporter periplasmic adaptor subunit [Pyrinomonadaceae bacterium]
MISRNKFTLSTVILLLAALSLFASGCGRSAESKNKQAAAAANATPEVVTVSTAAAITRELPRFVEATGSLAADEQTDVAPTVAGRVVAVGVDLGSYVQRGSLLVRLDDADARLRLTQLQAQAQQAQSAVRQAEERIGLRHGQAFDPNRVAEVGAARVALELAEKQLRRFERLIESGDVSRSDYDRQKSQRDQLQQQYEAALQAARQNYAGIATARAAANAAEAQVAQARKAVSDVVVYAPISGYVADRPADIGEYVSTTSKIATIVRTNPLRMRIDIPEQAISTIQPGQSVSITTSSYADRSFAGRIARISPNITAASRTLTVEAEVDNSQGLLKPGQFATVRISQTKGDAAVLIPSRAVRTEQDVSRVFVIKDGRVQERVVQLGQVEGELVEVKTGIGADELVATSNVEQLKDGAAVRQ